MVMKTMGILDPFIWGSNATSLSRRWAHSLGSPGAQDPAFQKPAETPRSEISGATLDRDSPQGAPAMCPRCEGTNPSVNFSAAS